MRGRRLTIEEMQSVAESKGGSCLSPVYTDVFTKLTWMCEFGHIWNARPNCIKTEHQWCPICFNENERSRKQRLSIQEMQKIAESRNGKCLSAEYVNVNTKLLWRCQRGHSWWATPDSIKHHNRWCPYCTSSIQENTIRRIFETKFNRKFPNVRPSWLVNPETKKRLELDGYNAELHIAFEVNGPQHYRFMKMFHRDIDEFIYRKRIDRLKKHICKKNGINLIVIPFYIPPSKWKKYILSRC